MRTDLILNVFRQKQLIFYVLFYDVMLILYGHLQSPCVYGNHAHSYGDDETVGKYVSYYNFYFNFLQIVTALGRCLLRDCKGNGIFYNIKINFMPFGKFIRKQQK